MNSRGRARSATVGLQLYRVVSKALSSRLPTSASRQETATPAPRLLVPDGCNLGVVLRVLLALLAVMAVASAVAAPGPEAGFDLFLRASTQLAMAGPATLLAWCVLRRRAGHLSPTAQRALAWVAPMVFAALAARMLDAAAWTLAAQALLGLAAGVTVQYVLELRDRAYSPAVAEARFQALQSRIRPHFLFNSLNAVLSVVRTDPPKAERMLESIAELFRAVMADTRRLVPLADEISLCRDYIEIEQTRLGERLQVDWQIGAYHPNARVPQLLLQPILENAVRYGAERHSGAADIVVAIRQRGFKLEIEVSNPIAAERPEREGNQMGLANIRGRLALIYDLEAQLETRVHGERFELKMVLPVERGA